MKSFHLNLVSYFSIFDPKVRCSLQKKSFHLNFVTIFCSLISHYPKILDFAQIFSCHCPKILDFAQIFSCHCPKNFNFAQILETRVSIFPPCPPGRYGYDWLYRCFIFYSNVKIRTIN